MQHVMTCQSLTLEGIVPRSNQALALAAGLVLERVYLDNFSLYAAYYKGTLFFTVFCEQYDDPAGWESRSEGEKRAMVDLAMDEWGNAFSQ